MKALRITIGIILFIIIFTGLVGYFYLLTHTPTYSGKKKLEGLAEKVEIIYDDYGVPHIYAANEQDAYYALGYAHAQERLWQMELITRLATGTLSEMLGPDLIETDKFFRTLGMAKKAEAFAAALEKSNEPYALSAKAYFKGVNAFVKEGHNPVEFTLLGIPDREYSVKNSYYTAGVLAFGFAPGLHTDPVVAMIESKLGSEYLNDLSLFYRDGTERIPVTADIPTDQMIALNNALNKIPLPLWNGSNGWVVNGTKSASGSPLFQNDTHIGFAQPSVWFEAHLEFPGKSFYGHHAAGIPFGILGRNRFAAWGMTMFENDDVDFYRETVNPSNPNQYKNGDDWNDFVDRTETIKVKDGDDVQFTIRETVRGPIMNLVNDKLSFAFDEPVSVWWAFREVENDLLQIIYKLDHHTSIDEAKEAASKIEAPGLNVMYANTNGDIAWWAAAKLPIRADSINSKTVNDGSVGEVYEGFYPFEDNPQSVNPSSGYVYSANNQPDSIRGVFYPGYYVPEDRAKRINSLLSSKSDWSSDDFQEMTLDHVSINHPIIAKEMVKAISKGITEAHLEGLLSTLNSWDGSHLKNSIAPTIYYTWLSYVIKNTISDELGDSLYAEFGTSHLMKRTYLPLIKNDSSVWWENVNTEQVESRSDILQESLNQAYNSLSSKLGDNTEKWYWSKVHKLEHPHALGKVDLLAKIFNVGKYPVEGGMEVINNLMFKLNTDLNYNSTAGPAIRNVVDLADIEHSYAIIPTGQSGNVMSHHYKDQAKMFAEGEFRTTTMNRSEIEQFTRRLVLVPKK